MAKGHGAGPLHSVSEGSHGAGIPRLRFSVCHYMCNICNSIAIGVVPASSGMLNSRGTAMVCCSNHGPTRKQKQAKKKTLA